MANIAQVPAGVSAPVPLLVLVESADLDLTTVSGATILIRRSCDGSTATWAATVSQQTPTSCLVSHTFGSGDCPAASSYPYTIQVAVQLAVPGGTVPCYGRPLSVTDPYAS